jgi:hypothetical protein
MITITCTYKDCHQTSTGSFRIKSGRKYYDCPKCGRAMRLKEIFQKDSPTLLIPISTGRENRNMQLVHVYIRRDIMAELRKLPNYSETINLILAKHLEM